MRELPDDGTNELSKDGFGCFATFCQFSQEAVR